MDTRHFYDDLADLYDVIYHDWEASSGRRAETILTISSDLRGPVQASLGKAGASAPEPRIICSER